MTIIQPSKAPPVVEAPKPKFSKPGLIEGMWYAFKYRILNLFNGPEKTVQDVFENVINNMDASIKIEEKLGCLNWLKEKHVVHMAQKIFTNRDFFNTLEQAQGISGIKGSNIEAIYGQVQTYESIEMFNDYVKSKIVDNEIPAGEPLITQLYLFFNFYFVYPDKKLSFDAKAKVLLAEIYLDAIKSAAEKDNKNAQKFLKDNEEALKKYDPDGLLQSCPPLSKFVEAYIADPNLLITVKADKYFGKAFFRIKLGYRYLQP